MKAPGKETGLLRRLRVFGCLMAAAWPPAFAILGVVGGAVALLLWFRCEPAFRWVGLALQLLGVATVALDIRDRRRAFQQPNTVARIQAWLRGIVGLWRKPASASMNVVLDGVQANAEASTSLQTGTGPDTTLDRRVQILEENLEELRAILLDPKSGISSKLNGIQRDLEAEVAIRAQQHAALQQLLQHVHIGGLDLSAIGLVWLAAGLILATGSVELDWLLKQLLSTVIWI